MSKIVELLQNRFGEEVKTTEKETTPISVEVAASSIKTVCNELYTNETTYFDMLSCITGIDNGLEENTMEVVYNLYSIPYDEHLMIYVTLPRENPEIDSLCDIWKTANWHEREAFDLLGIRFKGHPDLRRILLPADWDGHPLKKDYKHQEYYRGIKVEY